jgi:hypothetical protein
MQLYTKFSRKTSGYPVDPDPQAATTTTLPTNNNFEIVRDMAISSAKNLAIQLRRRRESKTNGTTTLTSLTNQTLV